MKTTEQILKEYREACLEISEQCVAEGYPSHGSNYELRCEQLWNDYYKSEYDMVKYEEDMHTYLVVTQYGQYGDAFVQFESDDIKEAKEQARILAASDKKDARTFITTRYEWENGNYNEIEY